MRRVHGAVTSLLLLFLLEEELLQRRRARLHHGAGPDRLQGTTRVAHVNRVRSGAQPAQANPPSGCPATPTTPPSETPDWPTSCCWDQSDANCCLKVQRSAGSPDPKCLRNLRHHTKSNKVQGAEPETAPKPPQNSGLAPSYTPPHRSYQASSGPRACGPGCPVFRWGQNWRRAGLRGCVWGARTGGYWGWMSEAIGSLGWSDLPIRKELRSSCVSVNASS